MTLEYRSGRFAEPATGSGHGLNVFDNDHACVERNSNGGNGKVQSVSGVVAACVIVKIRVALAGGSTVRKCFDVSEEIARTFSIPFLFMSYYNILFKYGVGRFAEEMSGVGVKGAIVPDLPPEEGKEYLDAMEQHGLDPIFIFSPTTSDHRMAYLASFGKGFIYCVARKGVTGVHTDFSEQLDRYLARCRKATELPLALGFGVKDKKDVDFLKGKADIAVIGSQTIRLIDKGGVGGVSEFIRGLEN